MIPTGFSTVSGTAYRFGLPSSVKFVADENTVTEDGQVLRRWRYAIAPQGPYCVVTTVEQAGFSGDFPGSVVALFASHDPADQHNVRNDVMQPNPAGTIGGVDQEATLTATLDNGKKVPARLFQRKYLTPGHSLIAISVAGPTANSAQCQYSAIVQSFSATGQEFNGATPAASPSS